MNENLSITIIMKNNLILGIWAFDLSYLRPNPLFQDLSQKQVFVPGGMQM